MRSIDTTSYNMDEPLKSVQARKGRSQKAPSRHGLLMGKRPEQGRLETGDGVAADRELQGNEDGSFLPGFLCRVVKML